MYQRIVANPEFANPINGGGMPRRSAEDNWNAVFAGTFQNRPLEKNLVPCQYCDTPNCTLETACPNCDRIVC